MQSNDRPLVSVVVASYRREQELQRALASIEKQTYPRLEAVVVDDSGEEAYNRKTAEVVETFRASVTFPVVLVTNPTNQGSAAARNRGVREANGEYITFLDDDDVYLPEKVACQLEAMQKEQADYGLTDLHLYNERDKLTDKRIHGYIESKDPKDLIRYHLMYHMTGTDCLMFKKDYFLKIGGFPGINVGDEFYLMSNAIQGGGKLSYLPDCHVKAYVHTGEAGGLSSGQGKIDGENALFEHKKTFFEQLTRKQRRYIVMRHYAVLAFAYYRMNKKSRAVVNALKAVTAAPCMFCGMLFGRK